MSGLGRLCVPVLEYGGASNRQLIWYGKFSGARRNPETAPVGVEISPTPCAESHQEEHVADVTRMRGIIPPSLTPLNPDHTVDGASTRRLTRYLIDSGVHGIWALGTTGEFTSLSESQRLIGLEAAVEGAAGRVPVIANVSDCSTELTIQHARNAAAAGADAVAATPPYYYANSMNELLEHFRAIRAAVDLPLFAYSIPQTVKVKFELETAVRLAEEGTCVGIKDSQNDLVWFRSLARAVRASAPHFRLFIGTDALIDCTVAVGGHAAIPGISNVAPRECVAAIEAAERGDPAGAARAQEAVFEYQSLFGVVKGASLFGGAFAAQKAALVRWGVIAHPTVSGPFRSLTPDEEREIDELLRKLPDPVQVTA